jgi:hypothetical protein
VLTRVEEAAYPEADAVMLDVPGDGPVFTLANA